MFKTPTLISLLMKTAYTLIAALLLTGLVSGAHAQTTKPMAKEAKTESKAEESMETKKEEKMETAKSGKTMHHGKKMHHAKAGMKGKM